LIGAGATAGLAFPSPAFAGTFNIACGDVYGPSGLVGAINAANASVGGTINLASGCTYTLTKVDNTSFEPNGLPVVISPITINGDGATITRNQGANTPVFRIFEVSRVVLGNHGIKVGKLTLNGSGRGVLRRHAPLAVTGGSSPSGGGILNFNGALSLNFTQVSNNTATDPVLGPGGGGISDFAGTTTLNNSQVIHNAAIQLTGPPSAGAGGGGIDSSGTLTVNNSEVNNNTVSAANGAEAAGIRASTLTMNDSQVNDNAATAGFPFAFCGGLCVAGPATLNFSAVDNNTVTDTAPRATAAGAGIGNFSNGALKLNFTLVRGNTTAGTTAQGAGLWNSGGTVTSFFGLLQGNTVSTSLGTAVGGGIFTNGGSVALQTSAVLGNAASGPGADGGGIENIGSAVTLALSAVVANVPNNCRPPGSVPGCIG
jgi:hypothetical protein